MSPLSLDEIGERTAEPQRGAQRYGESHFLYHFHLRGGLSPPHRRMLHHVLPLVAILGGVAPAIAVFGLGALGAPRRAILIGAALVLLGYVALALVPDQRLPYSKVCLPRDRTALAATIRVDDFLPLTMMPAYYVGRTPILHLDGPRALAELYRVEMDFVACTPA